MSGLPTRVESEFQCMGLRLLWVVTLDPSVGEYHGAGMRFLNFARELSKCGAQVYFAVNVWSGDDQTALEKFLSKLQTEGVIAGSLLMHYGYSPRQGRLGAFGFHPGLTNWILRDVRKQPADELLQFSRERGITAAIISDRKLLFLGLVLQQLVAALFDWTDSMALYYWRALASKLRKRQYAGLPGFLRDYQNNLIAEFYYGRRATLNLVVSPVDKLWFDRTNLRPARNRIWMNGTRTEESAPAAKIPKRLIFSGAMDYAPNYEGALWFIDRVFPLILKRHPDARFVVAGVNPVPELSARANERIEITGFVEDLGAEIAHSSLYVAPLLSGGGFRNKVIEAVMRGTYLIGTSISVEFLPVAFQSLLSVADTPQKMADAVVDYFEHPGAYVDRLKQLRENVMAQFSWSARTYDLLGFLAEAEDIHVC
jgi:glycosyltransferase involved in cell wall biosynthesis